MRAHRVAIRRPVRVRLRSPGRGRASDARAADDFRRSGNERPDRTSPRPTVSAARPCGGNLKRFRRAPCFGRPGDAVRPAPLCFAARGRRPDGVRHGWCLMIPAVLSTACQQSRRWPMAAAKPCRQVGYRDCQRSSRRAFAFESVWVRARAVRSAGRKPVCPPVMT